MLIYNKLFLEEMLFVLALVLVSSLGVVGKWVIISPYLHSETHLLLISQNGSHWNWGFRTAHKEETSNSRQMQRLKMWQNFKQKKTLLTKKSLRKALRNIFSLSNMHFTSLFIELKIKKSYNFHRTWHYKLWEVV